MADANHEVDPLLLALFKRLPPAGSVWPEAARDRWFIALNAVLNLIYVDEDTNPVKDPDEVETAEVDNEPEDDPEPESDADDHDGKATYYPAYSPTPHVRQPKPERPANLPTSMDLAREALMELGPSSGPQILTWVRRKYWADCPTKWTNGLYGLVQAGKLGRTGINFRLTDGAQTPAPAPTKVQPARPVAPAVNHLKFTHKDESISIPSAKMFSMASRLHTAIGKGHLDEKFLANAVYGSQSESYLMQLRDLGQDLNTRLFPINLKVEFHKGFGYCMKEIE